MPPLGDAMSLIDHDPVQDPSGLEALQHTSEFLTRGQFLRCQVDQLVDGVLFGELVVDRLLLCGGLRA